MRTGETRPPHRNVPKRAPRKSSEPLINHIPLRLSRQDLPTPTTTSKDEPCCPCWDLHQAAAAREGAEAVRRYLVSGGDPGAEQWGNIPLHVSSLQKMLRTGPTISLLYAMIQQYCSVVHVGSRTPNCTVQSIIRTVL